MSVQCQERTSHLFERMICEHLELWRNIEPNFQKSLAMNNTLLNQQYSAYSKQYQTGLDELKS